MGLLPRILLSLSLLLLAALATAQTLAPLCTLPSGRCVDPAAVYTSDESYVGHDEPALLFYSNTAGAGNSSIYLVRLPIDPPTLPNQKGTGGTFNFQLNPAFWVGMALCDTQSFPEYTDTCTPDSDVNIFDNPNPHSKDYIGHHPGGAFTEMQFYPPGWVRLPYGTSCDATHYCAAVGIFSYEYNPVTGLYNNNDCQTHVGVESLNYAFITTSGKPHAPPSPLAATIGTYTFDSKTDLAMNPGDLVRVTMQDSTNGLQILIDDLTTGDSGSMTASPANGFVQIKFDPLGTTCSSIPYAFHPMYSTSSEHTRVPWTAHSYNIAFSDELGHFEFCDALNNTTGNCTKAGVNDPEGLDSDDTFCWDALQSPNIKITGCEAADLDFDGPSYLFQWPGTFYNTQKDQQFHPLPFQFTSPLFISSDGKQENFSSLAFEADTPDFEPYPPCNRNTGQGCTVPPAGAKFYPFYSTTQSSNPDTCIWQFGGPYLPNTTNSFGGSATSEFGGPFVLYFPVPFGFTGGVYDLRRVLNNNPCPQSASASALGRKAAGNSVVSYLRR